VIQIRAAPRANRSIDPASRRVLGTLLAFFGVLVLLGGFALGRNVVSFRHEANAASGTVCAFTKQRAQGTSILHAIVRFSTADGGEARFTDSFGSNPPSFRIGDQVRVLYLPGSPSESAQIDRGRWNLLPSFIVATIGLLLLGTGLSMVHSAGRAIARPATEAAGGAVRVAASDDAPTWIERHSGVSIAVLAILGCVLLFAPPHAKIGDAATGAFAWLLGMVVVVLRIIVHWIASPLLAGASAVAAVRTGATEGLDAGAPMKQWVEAADASPGLHGLLLHYRDLRGGLAVTAIMLLLSGTIGMGKGFVATAMAPQGTTTPVFPAR
jgi:hypothetical protein